MHLCIRVSIKIVSKNVGAGCWVLGYIEVRSTMEKSMGKRRGKICFDRGSDGSVIYSK